MMSLILVIFLALSFEGYGYTEMEVAVELIAKEKVEIVERNSLILIGGYYHENLSVIV